jgi:hypothetical protein
MNTHDSEWIRWPVAWTAIWVGALTALAVGLVIGLLGLALGATEVTHDIDWKKFWLIALVVSVGGAFFAFVAGGWTAARIAGIRRSEPAMLHGAIVWLVALPLLLILTVVGGTAHFGGWYGGLAGAAPWINVAAPDPNLAAATRNSALATVVALLLGLVGGVLGGWVASGEPMNFTHHRKRDRELRDRMPLKETVQGRPR